MEYFGHHWEKENTTGIAWEVFLGILFKFTDKMTTQICKIREKDMIIKSLKLHNFFVLVCSILSPA